MERDRFGSDSSDISRTHADENGACVSAFASVHDSVGCLRARIITISKASRATSSILWNIILFVPSSPHKPKKSERRMSEVETDEYCSHTQSVHHGVLLLYWCWRRTCERSEFRSCAQSPPRSLGWYVEKTKLMTFFSHSVLRVWRSISSNSNKQKFNPETGSLFAPE